MKEKLRRRPLTDHPTPVEIAGLVRGRLSHSRRRRLVAHLLRGCRRCSQLLVPALALTPSLVTRQGGRQALRRAPLLPAAPAAEAETALPAGSEEDYERPVMRACAAALRRRQELERERGGALAVGAAAGRSAPGPLAASPGDATPIATGAVAAAEARGLGGFLRVEMLLAASADLRYTDAREMVRLAQLARLAAERLDEDRCDRAAVADLRARTWAELANAHRVADDLDQAERAMARAVACRASGSGDPWLVARIGTLMASLLADQRRFAEAALLLDQVHDFHWRTGDRHLAGRALIQRGIFAGYDNQPRAALVLLARGIALIDSGRDWRLAAQAVHAILWNLVSCRRFRQARIHLWRSRALLVHHGGPLYLLRLRWLEGRIHAGLGELDRAERALLATRAGFAAAASPYNAALASLDLAEVWLEQRKTREVRQLVDEMLGTFRALRIAREAMAALLILREACERDEATVERVRTVARLIGELERQPYRRLAPLAPISPLAPSSAMASPAPLPPAGGDRPRLS
jgi:hypothetical protein